jgi:antitoxin CptB
MTETNQPPIKPLDNRRRRLIFRAQHRGTHENDLLIGGFVETRIATMTEPELDEIEAVMEFPDAELADWLTGRKPIPPHADTPMLRRIRAAAREWSVVSGQWSDKCGT